MQRGSALPLVILVILLVILGSGIYFFQNREQNSSPQVTPYSSYDNYETYSNQVLGFTFKYANELNVKEDTEEEFDKRGNGNFRKNFKGYVAYEPGKFLGAVVVLDKDQQYETNPFTLWVFDNPDDLTIDDWHHKYWYYPFVWGDFTAQGKFDLAPKEIATISGQTGKSGVIDYQPGKPKFVYVSKDQKMYLFRIIGENGDKILSTVKF